jgi:hypothetical protein
MRFSPAARVALAAVVVAAAVACASKGGIDGYPPGGDPNQGGASSGGLPPPRPPDQINDGGSFNVGNRGKDGGGGKPDGSRPDAPDGSMPVNAPEGGGGPDSGPLMPDTGVTGDDATGNTDSGAPDATMPDSGDTDSGSTGDASDGGVVGPPDACAWSLGAGDVAIVELMIASQAGPGDRGEWFEVQSTRQCSVNLNGLHVESQGATDGSIFSLDVTTDLWVPPNGFVVVADSADPVVDDDLPGTLLVWNAVDPADTLDDTGGQLTLSAGQTIVDSLPYPAFQLYAGTSISFPADCAWSDRASWARWSYSFNEWTTGFFGTPNADNTDVACY